MMRSMSAAFRRAPSAWRSPAASPDACDSSAWLLIRTLIQARWYEFFARSSRRRAAAGAAGPDARIDHVATPAMRSVMRRTTSLRTSSTARRSAWPKA